MRESLGVDFALDGAESLFGAVAGGRAVAESEEGVFGDFQAAVFHFGFGVQEGALDPGIGEITGGVIHGLAEFEIG